MLETENFVNSLAEGTILCFDKPLGWTSFDVVNKFRVLARQILGLPKLKAGHAGTLDPLATGLLIICTGKQTKSIESFQEMEKEYTGIFTLGQTTPSFDLETQPDASFATEHIDSEDILLAMQRLTGTQDQLPPLFSAKMVDGKRAYKIARQGGHAELKTKSITISTFELTHFNMPDVGFRVLCSKGTYIRSLARDFGAALGSGAYLKELRRTRIGQFEVAHAWSLESFEKELRSLSLLKDLG